MDRILDEVKEAIRPNKKEKAKLNRFARSVITAIKKDGYHAQIEGSLAKDTWVSGNHDVDVFVFFPEGTERKVLEKEGLKLGKRIIRDLGGKPEIAYAEHPYARTKIRDIDLDIVPCYRRMHLESLHSSVDRTPFHTKYVQKRLKHVQKDEVRLLKQFTKGIGVYSAKEKVRGFSGYLCELLILKYGSFKKVVKATRSWEFGLVLDLVKHYKNRKSAFEKFEHALVVVDPTDMNRNVAAALDNDNFERFIVACKEFIQKPSIQFFFPNLVEPLPVEDLKKTLANRGKLVLLKFKTPNLVEDILYSQLRKSLKVLVEQLEREDFNIIDSDFNSNKSTYFLLEFEHLTLPKIMKMEGPPITIDKKCQDIFSRKYKKYKPWIEDERWYVEVPRKNTNAVRFLRKLISNPTKTGIGKYVAESLDVDYIILQDKDVLNEYDGDFARFLTRYLTKKKPWEW